MKKLLVVLLALTFVVAMATAAFAVTTASVDGKVEVALTGSTTAEANIAGTVDGKLIFDLAKDYGDGYKAGLKIKIEPNAGDEVYYDGSGWIEITKDYAVMTVSTGIGGNSSNELGTTNDMISNPGIQVVSTSLMDGLTLTGVINENTVQFSHNPPLAGEPINVGNFFNVLLKGVYTADALTVGAGYQMHSVPEINKANNAKDQLALWGSYKIGDSLTVGGEYASRPNVDGFDGTAAVKGSTAIMLKANYAADALTLGGKVQIQTGKYITIATGDMNGMSAFDMFKNGNAADNGVMGTAIKVDATYKLSDALSLSATVEDTLAGAKNATTGVDLTDKQLMSYKLSVADALSDSLALSGWYSGFGDKSEIGISLTDTLVAGLVAYFEVKSNTSAPGVDPVNSYTAKITATL